MADETKEPQKIGVKTVESLTTRVKRTWAGHVQLVTMMHPSNFMGGEAELSFFEKMFYIYLPSALRLTGSILSGTLAGNVATLAANEIPDITKSQGEDMTKAWYTSKTIWTNVIALLWIFVGPAIGTPELSPETSIAILGVINVILRMVTKTEVTIS